MILGIYHVNINVSSLERSIAFYELLGFKVLHTFNEVGTPSLDRGLGLAYTNTRAAFMGLGNSPYETVLDVVEWNEPKTKVRDIELSEIGMPRLCLRVKGLDQEMARLSQRGIEFVSSPQRLDHLARSPRFVLCRDPDGLVVEMVEFGHVEAAGADAAA